MTQTSTAVKYQSDSISFSCYENEIPPFVEAEMERLYGSLYSSIPQLRVGGNLDGVSTYVVQKGRELVTIFLFRIDGRRLEVLNEVIRIEEEDIRRFATYIFSGFGAIDVVSFHAIQMDFGSIPFKYQQFECLEDIVVPLPGNTEDYTASLGRSTRKNLRYYRNALMHAFPSFRFSIYEKGAIEPQHVRDIIDLNRARMADKNIVSGIDEAEAAKLNYLARERGLVVVATIDGHVCAGAITFRVGENFFCRCWRMIPRTTPTAWEISAVILLFANASSGPARNSIFYGANTITSICFWESRETSIVSPYIVRACAIC